MASLILADVSVSMSEFKRNPIKAVSKAEGAPIVVLDRNKPAFYAVPSETFEAMMERIEDLQIAKVILDRRPDEEILLEVDEL